MNTTQRQPRLFRLVRHAHVSGLRGTGTLGEGVEWSDGTVALRWRGPSAHTSTWEGIPSLLAMYGAGGRTQLHWLRGTPSALHPTVEPPVQQAQGDTVWLPAPALDGLCSRCGRSWPCFRCGLHT